MLIFEFPVIIDIVSPLIPCTSLCLVLHFKELVGCWTYLRQNNRNTGTCITIVRDIKTCKSPSHFNNHNKHTCQTNTHACLDTFPYLLGFCWSLSDDGVIVIWQFWYNLCKVCQSQVFAFLFLVLRRYYTVEVWRQQYLASWGRLQSDTRYGHWFYIVIVGGPNYGLLRTD